MTASPERTEPLDRKHGQCIACRPLGDRKPSHARIGAVTSGLSQTAPVNMARNSPIRPAVANSASLAMRNEYPDNRASHAEKPQRSSPGRVGVSDRRQQLRRHKLVRTQRLSSVEVNCMTCQKQWTAYPLIFLRGSKEFHGKRPVVQPMLWCALTAAGLGRDRDGAERVATHLTPCKLAHVPSLFARSASRLLTATTSEYAILWTYCERL